MWHGVPFACQRRPIVGVLRMCWLLPGSFDCFCCPHTSVHRPSIACLAVFLCGPGALFLQALSGPSTICPFPPHGWSAPDGLPLLLRKQPIWAAGDNPHLMPVEQGLPWHPPQPSTIPLSDPVPFGCDISPGGNHLGGWHDASAERFRGGRRLLAPSTTHPFPLPLPQTLSLPIGLSPLCSLTLVPPRPLALPPEPNPLPPPKQLHRLHRRPKYSRRSRTLPKCRLRGRGFARPGHWHCWITHDTTNRPPPPRARYRNSDSPVPRWDAVSQSSGQGPRMGWSRGEWPGGGPLRHFGGAAHPSGSTETATARTIQVAMLSGSCTASEACPVASTATLP